MPGNLRFARHPLPLERGEAAWVWLMMLLDVTFDCGAYCRVIGMWSTQRGVVMAKAKSVVKGAVKKDSKAAAARMTLAETMRELEKAGSAQFAAWGDGADVWGELCDVEGADEADSD